MMLRWSLGMMFALFVTVCFAKPSMTSKSRCGAKEYYSYGEGQCMEITSNIRLRSTCPKGTKAIGTGVDIHGHRALACANQDEADAKYEGYNRDTEGNDKLDRMVDGKPSTAHED